MAVVVKYTKPDGTKVYGDPGTTTTVPSGSTPSYTPSTAELRAGGYTNITKTGGKVTGYTRPVPEMSAKVTVERRTQSTGVLQQAYQKIQLRQEYLGGAQSRLPTSQEFAGGNIITKRYYPSSGETLLATRTAGGGVDIKRTVKPITAMQEQATYKGGFVSNLKTLGYRAYTGLEPTLSKPVGINLPGQKPFITTPEIRAGLRTYGLPGKVAAEFIPATVGGLTLQTLAVGAFTIVPSIVRVPAEGFIGYTGISGAFDITKPTEQRVASGLIGGLATAGFISETLPYVKGQLYKLSPKYKPVIGEEIVPSNIYETKLYGKGLTRTIKGVDKGFDIRIVEPGKGFSFSAQEQSAFIGKRVDLVSAQRNFPIKSFGRQTQILDPEGKGMGLFYSPTFEGTAGAVRESRLGINVFKDLFKVPKSGQISFKLGEVKPQIFYERGTSVTKTGLEPGAVRGIGYISSELEVTRLPTAVKGEFISGKVTGLTTIKGMGVKIFNIKVTPTTSPGTTFNVPGLSKASMLGRGKTFYISPAGVGAGAVSSNLLGRTSPTRTRGLSFATSKPVKSLSTFRVSKAISQPIKPLYSGRVTGRISRATATARPSTRTSPVFGRTTFKPTRVTRAPTRPTPTYSAPRVTRQSLRPTYRTPTTPGIIKAPKFKAKLFGKRSPYVFAKFKPRYTPSVKAYALGIKAKKAKKYEIVTGLFTRPLTI